MISTQTGGTFNVCTNNYDELYASFCQVKDCGFDAVDYNMDHFIKGSIPKGEIDDFWEKSQDELYEYFEPTKKAGNEAGVVLCQAHAAFPFYVEGKDDLNEYLFMALEKNIAICAYLDCPMLVVHSDNNPSFDERKKINMELYKKLIPAAKKYGVKICIENLLGVFRDRPIEGVCARAEEAIMYIDALNAEAGEKIFGFCLDTGHANLVGTNMREYIKKLGDRLICLHLHENDRVYDEHTIPYTHVCPGLDWESVIEGLREVGYSGALSFETFTGVGLMPKEVRPEVLKLISSIGRYMKNRIEG